jgi:hypothetical protein
MMSPLAAALMAATALVALPTLALADETTIIHEQKVVVPSQPAPGAAAETQTRQTTRVHRVAVHHSAAHHRVAMIHVRHTRSTHAVSAASAAVQTSAAVRTESQPDQAPQVVEDRRTVIRSDDEGDVERSTRIIRQGPNGMTSIEHSSAEGVSADAP